MIDIHSHIIPFVDDGCKSYEEAIEMIKEDVAMGVTTIVATPHHMYHRYEKSKEELITIFEELKKKVKEEGIQVTLLLGQEIYYTTRENIFEKLEKNEILTMNGTRYVLVEFNLANEPDDVCETLYNFSAKGYTVILAHVERYKWMTVNLLKEIKEENVYAQVNAGSLAGVEGFRIKSLAKKFIKLGLIDAIASDMHSFRRSKMDYACKKVSDKSLFEFEKFIK